jgi:predicted TPR repeat methyltransferase
MSAVSAETTALGILVSTLLLALLILALRHGLRVFGHVPLARLGWTRRRGAPREYVRALFDGYAEDYDQHLLRDLRYTAANDVSAAVARWCPAPIGHALDLGCGTGILGVLLRPRVEILEGVDLSSGMLAIARSRGIYDALREADLVAYLRATHARCDLITAADVMVYLGDLEAPLDAVRHALRTTGVFVFSTEASEEPGFRGLSSGRFAHHPDYVRERARASDLVVVEQVPTVLRYQKDKPVPGHIHVLRADRAPSSGAEADSRAL